MRRSSSPSIQRRSRRRRRDSEQRQPSIEMNERWDPRRRALGAHVVAGGQQDLHGGADTVVGARVRQLHLLQWERCCGDAAGIQWVGLAARFARAFNSPRNQGRASQDFSPRNLAGVDLDASRVDQFGDSCPIVALPTVSPGKRVSLVTMVGLPMGCCYRVPNVGSAHERQDSHALGARSRHGSSRELDCIGLGRHAFGLVWW